MRSYFDDNVVGVSCSLLVQTVLLETQCLMTLIVELVCIPVKRLAHVLRARPLDPAVPLQSAS